MAIKSTLIQCLIAFYLYVVESTLVQPCMAAGYFLCIFVGFFNRKLKSIDPDAFKAETTTALHKFDFNNGPVSEVVDTYIAILEDTLEKRAPLKKTPTQMVTICPQPPGIHMPFTDIETKS